MRFVDVSKKGSGSRTFNNIIYWIAINSDRYRIKLNIDLLQFNQIKWNIFGTMTVLWYMLGVEYHSFGSFYTIVSRHGPSFCLYHTYIKDIEIFKYKRELIKISTWKFPFYFITINTWRKSKSWETKYWNHVLLNGIKSINLVTQ